MSQYFPKPYESFGGDISVKVELSNYETKLDLKNATGTDTSKLAAKSDLASLKAEVDKIDVIKLKTFPIDLSKLSSNVVKNEVVKKTVCDKLVAKVNNIDTSGFVLKTKYDTDKSNLEKKMSDADKKKFLILVELLKNPDYNAKINEIEGKIPSISGLATTTALTAVENKIPDVSNFVKKKVYDAEILDIKSKYFTTDDCNRFTSEKLDLKIKKKDYLVNLTLLDSLTIVI